MKLDDKRKVIEALLCASAERSTNVYGAALQIRNDQGFAGQCTRLREQAAKDDRGLRYCESCVLAAYLLIESSPTLRLEWFGAP